jgi:hypothetical protein
MRNLTGFINEAEKSKKQKEYQEFFDKKLKKYGVDSPAKLSDEEKKKFFDEVDKGWKGDGEKVEESTEEKIEEKKVEEDFDSEEEEEKEEMDDKKEDDDKKVEKEEDEEEDEDDEEVNEAKNFKVGDKVKVTKDFGNGINSVGKGVRGKVLSIDSDDVAIIEKNNDKREWVAITHLALDESEVNEATKDALSRMDGLHSYKLSDQIKKNITTISNELLKEGFEKDDILDFFNDLVKKTL